jgi:hypothetical protein
MHTRARSPKLALESQADPEPSQAGAEPSRSRTHGWGPVSLGFGMSGKVSGDCVRQQVPQSDNVTAPRSFVSIIYDNHHNGEAYSLHAPIKKSSGVGDQGWDFADREEFSPPIAFDDFLPFSLTGVTRSL